MTIITGASSGIGAELARQLSKQGRRCALIGRDQARLQAVQDQCPGSKIYVADLAQTETIPHLMSQIEADFGPTEQLFLNAGIGETQGVPFDPKIVEKVIHTNLIVQIHCIAAILPTMLARNSGHIIGLSSLSATRGFPLSGAYSASKAGFSTFLESLRVDLHKTNIAVTTICPGYIRTPLTDRNTHAMPFRLEVDEAARRILKAVEHQRLIYRFPWPMALACRLLACMPACIFTPLAAMVGRTPKKPS